MTCVSRNIKAAHDVDTDAFIDDDSGIGEGIGLSTYRSHAPRHARRYYLSSEEEDSNASDDSEYTSESSWSDNGVQTTAISPCMSHCSLNDFPPVNTTEKALSNFEGFISNEWPRNWGGELRVLELQLMYGGEFCENMKLIDLSTPAHVRLDSSEVLGLLEKKITNNKFPMKCIERLVLPNVKELTSGDMVKEEIEKFCRALGGKGTTAVKVKEVIMKCDEVSSKFITGDLKWIGRFFLNSNLTILCVKESENKEFKKFCFQLRSEKKIDHYLRETFLLQKRPPLTDCTNTFKRRCTEISATGEDTDHFNTTEIESVKIPVSRSSYSTILQEHWRISELHENCINGEGVTIAFLDSGINIPHGAFTRRVRAVKDIMCNGNIDLTTDRSGHGTLCASIACGAAFKSTGSTGQTVHIPAGVAPAANIVMYKITGSTGQAEAGMITKALQQCLVDKDRHNIDIVLLPYGSDSYDCDLCDALDALVSQGVLVVTASGNNGKLKEISYPARFGRTICVGAHDEYGNTTPSTSKGRALDFTAPGKNLTGASSVHPSLFKTEGGTSFAAACVAGLLALIIQRARDIATVSSNAKQLSRIEPSVNKLVHRQDTIKKVLRNISGNFSEHKESDGYGCLKPTAMLLNDHKLLELLYEDILTTSIDD